MVQLSLTDREKERQKASQMKILNFNHMLLSFFFLPGRNIRKVSRIYILSTRFRADDKCRDEIFQLYNHK